MAAMMAAGGGSVGTGGFLLASKASQLEAEGWTGTGPAMGVGLTTGIVGGATAVAGGGVLAGSAIAGGARGLMRAGRAARGAGGRMIDRVAGAARDPLGMDRLLSGMDLGLRGKVAPSGRQMPFDFGLGNVTARERPGVLAPGMGWAKGMTPQQRRSARAGRLGAENGESGAMADLRQKGVLDGGRPSASNAGVGAGGDAIADAAAQSSGFWSGQGMAGAMGMGVIGAGTSWATGGDIVQGAAFGMGAGFAARGLFSQKNVRGLGSSITSNERFAADGMVNRFGSWASEATVSSRTMALSGAGLGGVMFGGSNKPPSHARGFNQHRGNGF